MDIDLRVTQMEGETNEYAIRLGYVEYRADEDEQWTLVRWPIKSHKIPPMGQILTTEGWRPVLEVKHPIKYIKVEDIEDYL